MSNENSIYTGLGKRKTSVAKVFLSKGKGLISINKIPFEIAFQFLKEEGEIIKNPFILLNLNNTYDIEIHVKGGGMHAQLEAIQLAISKALCAMDSSYRAPLHEELFLRRDSRIKERRKYGLKKARKAPHIQNVKLNFKDMAKKNLHPEWFQTKIFCDGKLIFQVGSTKEELSVDIWSGNHPFYTGSQRIIDTEGRVEKFERKYKMRDQEEIKK